MSATAVIPQAELAANSRGGYKSLLSKPTRLWQRNKTAPLVDDVPNKMAPPPPPPPPETASKKPKIKVSLALRETAAGNVFKLSTINGSGAYLPPSPCEDTKRDHWLETDQEELVFRLPNTDRLTKDHCFYTPSATI